MQLICADFPFTPSLADADQKYRCQRTVLRRAHFSILFDLRAWTGRRL